jgi:CheY-like chemotaxis protein
MKIAGCKIMSSFNNAFEAIKMLEENPDSGDALYYLLSKQDGYVEGYLRCKGYYQDEIERIRYSVINNLTAHAFNKLRRITEVYAFAVLALAGEANRNDLKKYKVWRETLTQPFYTCYIINDDSAMTLIWEIIINRFADAFVITGKSPNMDSSFEPVLSQKPDLILIDHMLPGMDGIEGIEVLKQISPSSACLLLSYASHEDNVVSAARKAGADMLTHYAPHRQPEIHALLWKTLENFQTGIQDYSPV